MHVPEYTSRDNPALRRLAALLREPARRKAEKRLVIEGERACCDAFRDGIPLTSWVWSQESWRAPRLAGMRRALVSRQGKIRFAVAPGSVLASVTALDNPSEVSGAMVAEAEWPAANVDAVLVGPPDAAVIVLDRIQDPGNVGTILRTAEAMGARSALLLSGTADLYGPKALRASAGSALRLPHARDVDPAKAREALLRHHYRIVGTVSSGGSAPWEVSLAGRVALIMGNEGAGIEREQWEGASFVAIPLSARAESVNVAGASAILLYEARRPGVKRAVRKRAATPAA